VRRPPDLIRNSSALLIVLVALSDIAYRLLVRTSVRRALGMER
jgi:hypothetical protein